MNWARMMMMKKAVPRIKNVVESPYLPSRKLVSGAL